MQRLPSAGRHSRRALAGRRARWAATAAEEMPEPNWNRMLQGATTDDERSLIAQLRAGQAEMLSHISAAEKPAPKIDWKRWEETLSSKDLVADYKKAYSTADFEKAASGSEYKEYLEQVRREHKDAMAKVGDLVTKIKDGIAQLKEEKQQVIQNKADLETATLASEMAKRPDLDKKFTEEFKDDKFF
ncbi:ATP synthase D chain, mitochondrial (ATP5H) [Plasmodiophora brassicae]